MTPSRAGAARLRPSAAAVAAWRLRAVDLFADLAVLAAIAVAIAWLYWRALFESGVWFPAGGGDLASLIYPNYRFAADSLRGGEVPFWNPFILTGMPFLADIQSGLLYPVNLVVFAIVPTVTYRVVMALALFHLWLAGALAYACGRGLGQRRLAALVPGIAYPLSDLFVVHIGNLNLIAVAAWLPLVLLAAWRTAAGGGLRWIAAGGAGIAMTALAGHVQPLLYGFVALAVVAIVHAWSTLGRSGRWPAIRGLVALVAMALLGLAAAAVQLIPAAELTAFSIRSAIPYERSTEYSLAPGQLISLLVPAFFGRGPDAYWGQWLRTEAGYVGVGTLVLAVVAVALRRDRTTRMLVLLGVVGLVMALGGGTALHGLVYRFVPLFGSLRAPARAIVLFDLALVLLAGQALSLLLAALLRSERRALDATVRLLGRALLYVLAILPFGLALLMLLREDPRLPRATGIVEGWAMFALWLGGTVALLQARRIGWLRPRTIAVVLAGWIGLDLVTNAQGLEYTRANPVAGFARPAVVDFLRRDPEPYRIDTDTNIWDVWQPNTAMIQRIPDVAGGSHPLELADFRRYWSALGSRSTPLYDLLNAKYAIVRKDTPLDWSKWQLAFDGDPELNVYRNARVLPRAFLVGRALVEPDHDRVLGRLQSPTFDPSAEVVLESGEPLEGPGAPGSARILAYGTSRLAVEIAPNRPAYLVLSEVWYPGWRAWVDGRPVPVRRADYLFRAVRVEPGDRLVELRFEPSGWPVALAITASAWLLIVLGFASARLRARRPGAA